jgi:hypothetical protein
MESLRQKSPRLSFGEVFLKRVPFTDRAWELQSEPVLLQQPGFFI